jgi:hypothetical protein
MSALDMGVIDTWVWTISDAISMSFLDIVNPLVVEVNGILHDSKQEILIGYYMNAIFFERMREIARLSDYNRPKKNFSYIAASLPIILNGYGHDLLKMEGYQWSI